MVCEGRSTGGGRVLYSVTLRISEGSEYPSDESSSVEDFLGLFRGNSSSSETASAISAVNGKDSEVIDDDDGVLGVRRGKRKFRAAS